MSRAIRLGFAAGVALAASTAWAAAGRSDAKAAGGDVWYDEFYSSPSTPAATSARVVTTAAARRAGGSVSAGQQPHKRAHGGDRTHGRGDHRPLARSR